MDTIESIFTNDTDIGADHDFDGTHQHTRQEILDYLAADPRHAVALSVAGVFVAIWRDGSDETFTWQELPLDEPDGDTGLTAEEALDEAIARCSAF